MISPRKGPRGHSWTFLSQFSPPWRGFLLEATLCHQQQLGELMAESPKPRFGMGPSIPNPAPEGLLGLPSSQGFLYSWSPLPHGEPEETPSQGASSTSQQAGANPNPAGIPLDPGIPSILTERGLCTFLVLLRGAEGSIPCRDRTKPSQGDTGLSMGTQGPPCSQGTPAVPTSACHRGLFLQELLGTAPRVALELKKGGFGDPRGLFQP